MTDTDKVLKQLYYQPGSPASFGGARALWTAVKTSTKYKNVNIRLVDVKKWLSEQTPYLLFKNRRVNYPRNKTSRIPGLGYQMGADTWTLTRYSQYNYGMGYVYCAIDMFSRQGIAVPMKKKDSDSVLKALKSILKAGFNFKVLFTDNDLAYKSGKMKAFLDKQGIHAQFSKNRLHSYMAERLIQTLANKLRRAMFAKETFRWVDLLPKIVKSYNNTKHSALCNGQYSPNEVTLHNQEEIYQYLYHGNHRPRPKKVKPKLKKGDLVLVSFNLKPFQKGYERRWSSEVYKIKRINEDKPRPAYTIETYDGDEEIEGEFLQEELQKITSKAASQLL